MSTLADLHRSVAATLASKRVGTPVFVRYLLHFPGTPANIRAKLAQVIHVFRGWFDQDLERIYAIGSIKERALSLTLEFRGGASGILSWTGAPGKGGGVDLVVLGNHGSINFDAGSDHLWDEAAGTDLEDAPAELVQLVERALNSHQPESARRGGQP